MGALGKRKPGRGKKQGIVEQGMDPSMKRADKSFLWTSKEGR